jgi:HPt (histidine-containing phosphotransfer) domain-containing protein
MDASLLSRIDVSQLATHSGADTTDIRTMLQHYLETAEDCLAQMERAAKLRNILSWTHALQEMKAASSAVTARRLAGLCTEAEIIRAMPHPQTEALLYHMQKELVILRGKIIPLMSEAA